MTKFKLITKAQGFAVKRHKNQLDDNGKNYVFSHCFQVANIIKFVRSNDFELIAAAYLHDTIEDTPTTYLELCNEFGKRVADLVMEVTHEGSKKRGYYFPRLHTKDGILLKFADRISNLSRMECWDEKRQNQYIKKSKFWKSEL